MTLTEGGRSTDAQDWAATAADPEFLELRRRLRRFAFPVTGGFLAWYLLYVVLADYAHEFMSHKLIGSINVGLVLGLLQFVTTFGITAIYIRFAEKRLDPLAANLRDRYTEEGR